MRLRRKALELLPATASGWRDILPVRQLVSTRAHLAKHALHKSALRNPCTHEHGVDGEEDPASLLKEDSRAENAEPESDFEAGYNGHAGIIVVLYEAADAVAERRRFRLLAGWRGWWWLNGGKQDAAGVCGHVEDAVDGEGEEGKRGTE